MICNILKYYLNYRRRARKGVGEFNLFKNKLNLLKVRASPYDDKIWYIIELPQSEDNIVFYLKNNKIRLNCLR